MSTPHSAPTSSAVEIEKAQETLFGRSLPYAFRALGHRNFRLFFIGQFVSRTGFWMQNMAQAWLIYRLTESSLMLGLVAFAGQVPTLLFGLFAGVVADRFNRYRVILIAMYFAMLQAFVLGILTMGEWITAWQIFFLAWFPALFRPLRCPPGRVF